MSTGNLQRESEGERDKAGGEEARSKTRKAWIKRRGRRKKSNNSKEQKKSVRKEGTRRDGRHQTIDDFSTFDLV